MSRSAVTSSTAPLPGLYFPNVGGVVNSGASIANPASLHALTALTVECFCWIAIAKPAYSPRILNFAGSNAGFQVQSVNAAGNAGLTISVGNGTTVAAAGGVSANIYTGRWLHVAGTWSAGSGTVTLWVNAVSIATAALAGTDTGNPGVICCLGNVSNNRGFPGSVQEVRISNVVRTITVPTMPYTTDANTLALWHLNEDAGTICYDSSGNGLNLTFIANQTAPLWQPGFLTGPGRRFLPLAARGVIASARSSASGRISS